MYIPIRGGASKANRLLMEALADRGHECQVVAPAIGRQGSRTGAQFVSELKSAGHSSTASSHAMIVRANNVEIHAVTNWSGVFEYIQMQTSAYRPDITLVSSFAMLETILERKVCPTVYIGHSPWDLPFGLGHAFFDGSKSGLLKRTDGILAVSQNLRDRIRKGCGREAHVIPFPAYGSKPFLCHGHYGKGAVTIINPCAYKGISIFAAVARRLPAVQFAAVPNWATTDQDLRALRRIPNVSILAPCDDIDRIFNQTQVIVIPSLWPEGFPLVAVEAMLRGLPVIASNTGGLPEAKLGVDYVLPVKPIREYRPGCDDRGLPLAVVPDQDTDPWVQTVRQLTSDPDHYKVLSQASRDAALQFVSGVSVDPFESFFQGIVDAPRSRPDTALRESTPVPDRGDVRTRIGRLSQCRKAYLAARLKRDGGLLGRAGRTIPRQPRSGEDNTFPLSFAQQRLWFLDNIAPADSRYGPPLGIRLRGPLNISALEQAFNEVIARHETLRTSFPVSDKGPVQRVSVHLRIPLTVVDLRSLDVKQRGDEILRIVEDQATCSFDLAHGPLIQVTLLRLEEDESILLLSIHHIVSDGWSLGVLFRDLEAFYRAQVTGHVLTLPELAIQYADFAIWQREHLAGPALEEHLVYWREQLKAPLPVLELPTDRSRPAAQSCRGAACHHTVSAATTGRLKSLAEQQGATVFMTLLAAFTTILYRWSGQEEIVVGSPIAGRHRSDIESLIGLFLNTVVLRVDLSGEPSFKTLLRRVRDVALKGYAHQELPFEKLVEQLQPQRSLNRTPLFQVLFNMLNYEDRPHLFGLDAEWVKFDKREAKFDLTLYAKEGDGGVELTLVYSTDLYSEARATEMLNQLGRLLEQITEHPDVRINGYSLLTEQAQRTLPDPRRRLDRDWAGSVTERLAMWAREHPDRPAIADSCHTWTYEQVDRSAEAVASFLRTSDIKTGDVVAIYGHRSAPLAPAVLGILRAGAVFVILDPAYPPLRLESVLKPIGPRGWVLIEAAGEPSGCVRDRIEASTCCLRLGPMPTVLKGDPRDSRGTQPGMPDAPAYLASTSGSSGRGPKIIVGTQRPISHFLAWHCRTFGLTDSDRFSMLSGLSHDPLLRDMLTPIWVGGTLCIPGPQDIEEPGALRAWMRDQRITASHLTPAMGHVLAETDGHKQVPEEGISSLRYLFYGGDVLTQQHVAAMRELAPQATCVNFYGATETPQVAGYYVVPEREEATEGTLSEVPIGQGIDNVQLLILNKSGALAGVGEKGEICVRSPYLSEGYVGQMRPVCDVFLRHPWSDDPTDRIYGTGDQGRYRPDGSIQFCGRLDRQMKIRGFRVEPAEIESTLRRHVSVKQAVVVPHRGGDGDKELMACVTTVENTSTLSLRRYLRDYLPAYMIPRHVQVVDTLPVTPNGKVDTEDLSDYLPLSAPPPIYVAPRNPMERRIAAIWHDVLGVEQIGVHDNFFDLGGHSLLVIKAVARIEREIGVRLSFREFFSQTLAQFAASCAEHVATGKEVCVHGES